MGECYSLSGHFFVELGNFASWLLKTSPGKVGFLLVWAFGPFSYSRAAAGLQLSGVVAVIKKFSSPSGW